MLKVFCSGDTETVLKKANSMKSDKPVYIFFPPDEASLAYNVRSILTDTYPIMKEDAELGGFKQKSLKTKTDLNLTVFDKSPEDFKVRLAFRSWRLCQYAKDIGNIWIIVDKTVIYTLAMLNGIKRPLETVDSNFVLPMRPAQESETSII